MSESAIPSAGARGAGGTGGEGVERAGWLRRSLPFLALYVAAVAVRLWVHRERQSPGHGDVADYFSVAKNLWLGRGFVVDYVWTFIVEPRGFPNPSNTWWMPLPSMLTALGFLVAGGATFAAAKWTMILVASLLPFVTFATARALSLSRDVAWAAAILAAGFHLFLDQTCVPLSYGPYTVFGGGALAAMLASRARPKLFPLSGLLLGLSYLSRGDSLVLFAPLALVFASSRSTARATGSTPISWRSLALCAGLFVAVCAPWWVRNTEVMGRPLPAGQSKMIWLREYSQWYTARSETLTAESYFEQGAMEILRQKEAALASVVGHTLECLFRAVPEPQSLSFDDDLGASWIVGLLMTPFLWLGLGLLLKRGQWILFVYLLCQMAFYGILFSALQEQSYRTALFSLLPTYVCAIVLAIDFCLTPLRRISPRAARTATIALPALAGALAIGNAIAIKPYLDNKGRGVERMLAPYRAFKEFAAKKNLDEGVFFVANPWEFTLETGIKSVMIPPDDAKTILEVGMRLGVTHLAGDASSWGSIEQMRPGVGVLMRAGVFEPLPDTKPFPIYRFKPEAGAGLK